MKYRVAIVVCSLLAVAGCAAPEPSAELLSKTPMPASTSLTPGGTPDAVSPDTQPDLQMAAGVIRIDELKAQADHTVKLFGTAGGDPAMNGLYTYLAFFDGPDEGWRIFRIGDFLDYKILGESLGRVDLELRESVMNEATAEISTRTRRVIVAWALSPDTVPSTVSVTTAK